MKKFSKESKILLLSNEWIKVKSYQSGFNVSVYLTKSGFSIDSMVNLLGPQIISTIQPFQKKE